MLLRQGRDDGHLHSSIVRAARPLHRRDQGRPYHGATSNLDILSSLFDPSAGGTGIGMLLLDNKKPECTTECTTPTIPFN